jgi:hypothetical protein
MVRNPIKIQEKDFLAIYPRTKSAILGTKLVLDTTIQKKKFQKRR